MNITQLLSSGNFIIVNKSLIKEIGLVPTILIGELSSEYNYWKNRECLVDECWFYSTVENINENTGLTEHEQREGIKTLINLGFIETTKMGVPAKRYFKINEETMIKTLLDLPSTNPTSSSQVNGPQEVRLVQTNKNKEIIINNKNNNIKKENIQKKERFAPPTVEEVRAYCQERGNNVDAQMFVDFYTSKNWMVGKSKMSDWKASVRTWERNSNKRQHTSNNSNKTCFGEMMEREGINPKEIIYGKSGDFNFT